jgi:hypothetical protein
MRTATPAYAADATVALDEALAELATGLPLRLNRTLRPQRLMQPFDWNNPALFLLTR